MDHPLHLAVAEAIAKALPPDFVLRKDPACGGAQQLPLFVGPRKARDTRMCCVDLLVMRGCEVYAIVEIEESSFDPTQICGKFFQAAVASFYMHDSEPCPVRYADDVRFLQVVDSSRFPDRSEKKRQGRQIVGTIRKRFRGMPFADYSLCFVKGPHDARNLAEAARGLFELPIPVAPDSTAALRHPRGIPSDLDSVRPHGRRPQHG